MGTYGSKLDSDLNSRCKYISPVVTAGSQQQAGLVYAAKQRWSNVHRLLPQHHWCQQTGCLRTQHVRTARAQRVRERRERGRRERKVWSVISH